ncbi:helix-turn-helix domain-containing protein [Fodinicola acaciae]|uniref:helix-turn-helix domain-containing protein n=1 Tax=Fodinicola acaciae TaxID=2681555 RepID=UPI001C9E7262|nr:helix-turn-helix transcriptional regulator [Fodinicola acaciae]
MSESVVGATVLRREIARRFEALRRQAGLTLEQLAKAVDKGRTTIQRIEEGEESVRFREVDVRAMLKVLGASPEETELLVALTAETRNSKKTSWWQAYNSTALPSWFKLYVALEDSAETISNYEAEVVPGLLQTGAYAETLFRIVSLHPDDDEIEKLVKVRLERQSLLTRPRAPHLSVVLNEAVVRRPIGGAAVMAEQLQHLLDMMQRTSISVRIVPFSVGAHGGAAGCPFSILNFPIDHRTRKPIEPRTAYVETLTGSLFFNDPDEVEQYQHIWQNLEACALDQQASATLIREAIEGHSRE